MESYDLYKQSEVYLENYIREHNIPNICELFDKEILIEFSSDSI